MKKIIDVMINVAGGDIKTPEIDVSISDYKVHLTGNDARKFALGFLCGSRAEKTGSISHEDLDIKINN